MDNDIQNNLIGKQAPDFTLDNENGEKITLSELRGQPVVLVFYPFDWSSTCTKEICGLRDNFGIWQTTGAKVFGISRDSLYCHKAWIDHLGLTYSLLADLVGDAAKLYGAWDDAKHRADRVTVVIDPEGIVRYVLDDGTGGVRDHTEALATLRAMASTTV